jgi:hypothetical protein
MTRARIPANPLLWCLAACALTTGCSTMSVAQRPETPDGEKCIALYAQVDERIDAAGVRDAGYHRIPGFPYLRADRYTASFAHELPNLDAFWEWVGYLRAQEDEAREVELRNLKLGEEQASTVLLDMRACGGWLRTWELDDAAFRDKMIEAVKYPDDYSTTQRVLGLYPIAVPFLESGLGEFRRDIEKQFEAPLAPPPAPNELKVWAAQANPNPEYPEGTIDLRDKPRDLLGRVGLVWSEIVHLAHTHAPALWIETGGDHDRPALAVQTLQGPGVDPSKPVVYYLTGLTRFGGRSLLQISYFVWFSAQVPSSKDDGSGGALDGLIWRVTLDEQGNPLVHDTIHASGGAHFVFPVSALQRREDAPETILIPQKDGAPSGPIAVRLRSGTHEVTRVVRADDPAVVATQRQTYELRSYEELLNLPDPAGGLRSFFGPDGFIAGTERSQRYWRWPSGVRNPGALRQWGHHPTALIGRAHFDDPFLFEQAFVAPKVAEPVAAAP